MSSTQCLTAAMLEVGMRHVARLSFTREQVAQYCALTGDHNAIHRDPEAARLRFPEIGDIVVPGGLIQTTVSGLFATQLPGDGSLGLTFVPERLRQPVCPDEEIQVALEITRIRGGIVELEVTVDDRAGRRVTSAKAKVLPPDETYRQWWQAQHR
ncbi:MaoC/PaaZ C-terminal domain-containing protein [Thiococcus pfennigii]|uniref:MaoC/PaaZ C-terminal domain-containing protein n=1 Tax=Thiococcus pfennigii TaxID=1057 RepID=UPI001903AF27|nr:hypothetical protein [Thiococcus pfennigii]